jgi:DNA-binding NarL/FixJ family response regulator
MVFVMSHTTPVIIADDHPLFRTALKQAVGQCIHGVEMLEADSIGTLLMLIDKNPSVELVLLDLHIPGNQGYTGLLQIRNHHPDLTVIMVSSDSTPLIMQRAIKLGAAAFIPKAADLKIIEEAIAAVLSGQTWLPDGCAEVVSDQESHQLAKLANQLSQLTPQQYVVLSRIADGQLNKQIAFDLDIQETTVKKHVSAILTKLEVNNRTLAGLAFQKIKISQ